jgi:hypothetical protein
METNKLEELSRESFDRLNSILSNKINNYPKIAEFDESEEISVDIIKQLMNVPVPLYVNGKGELYYIDDENEEVVINPRVKDEFIRMQQINKIRSLIPSCPFDLHCGGNRRKQKEAGAAFKVVVSNNFSEGAYADDIAEMLPFYDFKTYRTRSIDKSRDFCGLLSLIQQDASPTLSLILYCITKNISESKQKNAATYLGLIAEEDQKSLETMVKYISSVESSCNAEVKNLNGRFKRLERIQEKDDLINNYLKSQGERLEVLYKINSFNSTNINQIDTIKIKQSSRRIVSELVKDGKLEDPDLIKKMTERISNKAIRLLKRTIQTEMFLEFSAKKQGDSFGDILPKT